MQHLPPAGMSHLLPALDPQRPVGVPGLSEPGHLRAEAHLAAQTPEVSAVGARHPAPVDDTGVR